MLENKAKNKSITDNEGNIAVSKSKYPTWKENLSCYFSQYCGATSIHGVQYIGECGRLLIEKLVWIAVVISVWCVCVYLITKTYNKWVTSPVIVTFATTETSISQIPFPAVTISPEAKSDTDIFNYTDILIKHIFDQEITDEEDQYFQVFSLVCDTLGGVLEMYGIQERLNSTIDKRYLENLVTAFPNKFKDLTRGYWQGKEDIRDELLHEKISPDGLSYTFNMLDYSEIFTNYEHSILPYALKAGPKRNNWSPDEGYSKEVQSDTFPRRSFVSGLNGGFKFIDITFDNYSKYSCNAPLSGYKVVLHHPCELPNMDKQLRLPLDQAVLVAIKPKMITISENLKSYKPEDRKCYLSDERKLKFFKSYTQENCEQECILNKTLVTCRCVPFYMIAYNELPICGPKSKSCINTVKTEYILNGSNKCGCLPSCTSLEYDVEISQTDLSLNYMPSLQIEFIRQNLDFDTSSFHVSLLVVYYKEMQFLTSERNELYGYVDFFSNMGGLLGLFIGFSVTSVIEIIYFLTLRVGCNIIMFGKRFWSGPAESIK